MFIIVTVFTHLLLEVFICHYVHMQVLHLCLNWIVYIFVYMGNLKKSAFMRNCLHAYVFTLVFTSMYPYVCVCTCLYSWALVCNCLCVYMCTFVTVYIYLCSQMGTFVFVNVCICRIVSVHLFINVFLNVYTYLYL